MAKLCTNGVRASIYACLSLLALSSSARGQSQISSDALVVPGSGQAAKPGNDIPTHLLDLKRSDPIPGLLASPVTVIPAQCTADGTLFLDMLTPPDLREHTVYGIRGTKSKKFSPALVPGLHEVQVLRFFSSNEGVSFLIRATKETAVTPVSVRGANGDAAMVEKNRGEMHYFIATFDSDGQFKETAQLAIEYPVFGFAVLPSGEFLVTGYDQPNDTERLMLLTLTAR